MVIRLHRIAHWCHELGVPLLRWLVKAFVRAGAKIFGPITIGRYASIGANAAALADVPAFGEAVGVPARVVRINRLEDIPDYRAL